MAKGAVAIRMTNDYLFHALFQEDNEALKGFVCALLKLDAGQVKSAVVINPIELGTSVGDKEFILNPGEGCQRVKPVVHIGLLDFTLFPKFPEFYATHRLMNVKNHMIYSDKLQLSLVDLTHIDLATEEDMQHRIDCWAAFFKAATWEEIKMIAQRDENIAKAANTVWKLSQEDKIRLQCEAREDYYRNQRDMEIYMEKQAGIIAERESLIACQEGTIARNEETIARQAEQLSEKDSVIEALKAELERLKK